MVRRSPARTLLPFALLVVTLGALVRTASLPLGNNDTFFHLRFGHEFLSGAWSLRHPGSVTTFATADWLPTQWLPQVVMAQFEEWFGLPGVAWLAGLHFLTLALTLWLGLPPPGRAGGRCPDRRPGPRGLHVGDVDAAAADQLHPRRAHHRDLDPRPHDRAGTCGSWCRSRGSG